MMIAQEGSQQLQFYVSVLIYIYKQPAHRRLRVAFGSFRLNLKIKNELVLIKISENVKSIENGIFHS